MFETITYEVKKHVAWLTLNRPDKLNAFTEQMNNEIVQALVASKRDKEVRAIVISGSGRAFCSGEDLAGIKEGTDHGEILRKRYNPMVMMLSEIEKPIIAAVNGVAAGAGMSLSLACDFRLASDEASFIAAFIHVGLVPDSGHLYYLPRLVGYAKAMELTVLGKKVNPEEAKQIGLVTDVLAHDKFTEGVTVFAEKLANMPTKAIGLIKRYMQKSYETPLDKMLENESFAQRTAGLTDDHHEGVEAFIQKRKPTFKGW